ncbi:PREDICTED: sodium/hydrogen exchanger 4 isoform X1 [Fragaria vesca subsp. vesca]|uniref:sodium/hydrogen exchanger 4 isoform X1 n=2 Tax=Fragaria vesca subsp. vesca TaxID=101020 RepID=UPI0002C36D95|nr:PREDICTED: sodium/hydrogen exchanger 4 isoform X1 [Fragaria vesca subsp. vesca]
MADIYDFAKNLAHDHAQVIPISLFVAVLCVCLVVGHLFEENRWVNESITAIFIGFLTGTIILLVSKGKSSHVLTFDEELFFIYLLPPIIFNAGFQVKKKQFFQNFLTIMLFGVIGVFISTLIITAGAWFLFPKLGFVGLNARDYLAVGTIFSSTDTVCTLQVLHQDETPLLYSLVFGEGVVNDATSVVLFNAVQKIDVNKLNSGVGLRVIGDFLYLFSTSTALGVAFGLVTAYSLKTLSFGRHSSIREISVVVLMAYLSYMVAELLDLSGILTVFFCGILMSHYAWHNITESSRITTRHVFAMMSFIAETFIFLYVGMDALDIEKWRLTKLSFGASMGVYSTTLLLILLGRAAFVFPLSAFSNYMNRRASRRCSLALKHQVIIWWAGLIRGAVSIALAFKQFTYSGVTLDPINAMMITNTIIVVLFSTLVFGFLTKPLINYLLPHGGTNPISRKESKDIGEDMNLPLLSFDESAATNLSRAKDNLSMLIERPVYTIHSYWRRFDDAYMRPLFGGPVSDQSTC